MTHLNLRSLVERLNPLCRKALENAAALCHTNTHYEVEIEHYLIKLLENDHGDIAAILKYFEIEKDRVQSQLTGTLSRFKTGNGRTPALSPRLPKLLAKTWLNASIDFGCDQIRSGHLLLTLLTKPYFSATVLTSAAALERVKVSVLEENLAEITANSDEQKHSRKSVSPDSAAARGAAAPLARGTA